MDAPKRIQRKRTKGWKMPEGAVYVGRPTKWGNPYFQGHTGAGLIGRGMNLGECVEEFRKMMYGTPNFMYEARQVLRGKDLACWCPLVDKNGNPVPCHADVLLEIANS